MARPRTTRTGAFLCAVALAATGCGGGPEQPSDPEIPAAIAEALAETSDGIAARLEAGDDCAAAELAAELRTGAEAAVDDGSVPASLEEPLLEAVGRLADEIACEPELDDDENEDGDGSEDSDESDDSDDSWPPGKDKDKDKDKGEGKGKGKGKKGEEDDR